MRTIDVKIITETVKDLFIKANYVLPDDVCNKIGEAKTKEKSAVCVSALDSIEKNIVAAKELNIPVCQDTGMAVVFIDIGQDVHIIGGDFTEAVNEGVRRAYVDGYMRCSIVSDPLRRENTNDNTPALIHTRIVPGNQITITAAPKGFGSENMSSLKMFTPSATEDDIIEFVKNAIDKAGSNPCPPIIVGVGIGSDFEGCAILAKRALIRSTGIRNPDPLYAELEEKMLKAINSTGIGAQGFGGSETALAVNIEKAATHIAGLPVAVNTGCHVTRHKTAVI